jgi:hypothetical protein
LSSPIYQPDPEPAPDTGFVAADLSHLRAGNRGRLLDARRTPLTVTDVMPSIGGFEVEIDAFEDRGARWQLPLTAIDRLQFPADAPRTSEQVFAGLQAAVARFDRQLEIPIDPEVRANTLKRIAVMESELADGPMAGLPVVDVADHIRRREGSAELTRIFRELFQARDLADLDERFARSFVSNPESGEIVKGHAIVLAELGLCPYSGTIVRDPATFDGPWTKSRRGEHVIARAAATQVLWKALRVSKTALYRGAASETQLTPRPPVSLVSATFSEDVARAHYEGGPTTHTAILWRQRVPISRLFMTFLETPAMNDRYHEAEAVLFAHPANAAF